MSDAPFGITPVAWAPASFSDAAPDVTSTSASGKEQLHAWRRAQKPTKEEIEMREAVTVANYAEPDVAVLPGQAVTREVLQAIQAKERLRKLIVRFAKEGFCKGGEELKITESTAEVASLVVNLLPPAASLPKIVPSEEGALTVVWDRLDDPVILIISGWRLDIVTAAATPRAEYYDNVVFDGDRLPEELTEAISKN
ncbi:hypothetical protein [Burkholderia pyrrocinia]|uniref:Uncharacterized protein n=1 Tax=Burkholderia pyrrocinia TaxID=60550 RepID=A0ABZ3BFU5_BURPY